MTQIEGLQLYKWLEMLKGATPPVPPLCAELFLKNNRSYFLHSVVYWEKEDSNAVIRIWDFREMSENDIEQLKEEMNKVQDRKEYESAENIHTKLDWANLRIPKDYIAYVIEWHDRLWPRQEIGFNK